MNKWSRVAVTSAVALALASPAFAQSTSTPTTEKAPESTESTMPKASDTETSQTESTMPKASDTETSQTESTTPKASDTETSQTDQSSTPAGGDVIAEQKSGQTLSSDLIGMKVMGTDDEAIGEVSELIIEDNQVTGAVLNVGGFLGLGAKKVGVPWDALTVSEIEGSMVATVSLGKDQLTEMPEFKTQAEAMADQSRTTTGTTGGSTTPTQ